LVELENDCVMPRIRWTPEEDERLLDLIAAGKSWTLISGMLKRSMKLRNTGPAALQVRGKDGGSSDGREIGRGLSDVSGSCNHPVCSAGRGDKRSLEDPALHYRSGNQHSLAVPTLSVDRVI
jgi:hypothetical protein